MPSRSRPHLSSRHRRVAGVEQVVLDEQHEIDEVADTRVLAVAEVLSIAWSFSAAWRCTSTISICTALDPGELERVRQRDDLGRVELVRPRRDVELDRAELLRPASWAATATRHVR